MKRITRDEAIAENMRFFEGKTLLAFHPEKNGIVEIFTQLEAEMLVMLEDLFFGAAFMSRAIELEALIKKARGK